MENAANNLRVAQVFSARLVLEVFGGGGAIWGFSEVVTLRHPGTQTFWRINAIVVSIIFFLRFMLQVLDYIRERNHDKFILQRLVQIFSARLILEVFGGAGAIWGPAEAVKLRNENTVSFFRVLSCVAGVIFLIRYLLQVKDFIRQMKGQQLPPSDPMIQFFSIFSVKLVLEVFGSAGAVWGYSEVLTLRNPMTQELWRFNALTVGVIFFVRYCLQMKDFLLDIYFPDEAVVVSKEDWMQQCQAHAHDLALEVEVVPTISPVNLHDAPPRKKQHRTVSSSSAPARLELTTILQSESQGDEFEPLSVRGTSSRSSSDMGRADEYPSLCKRVRSFSANDALSSPVAQLNLDNFDSTMSKNEPLDNSPRDESFDANDALPSPVAQLNVDNFDSAMSQNDPLGKSPHNESFSAKEALPLPIAQSTLDNFDSSRRQNDLLGNTPHNERFSANDALPLPIAQSTLDNFDSTRSQLEPLCNSPPDENDSEILDWSPSSSNITYEP